MYPPDGWRLLTSRNWWVPNKRTKAGKEADWQIAETQYVSQLRVLSPFIDTQVMVPGHWYSAGCRYIAGTVYVTHNAAFQFESNEYFQQIPLSQYYAALESEE